MPPTVTITADSEGSCSDSDFGALVPVAAGHGLDDLRLLPPGRSQRRPARPAGARRRLAGSVALGTTTEFRSAARRGRRCIEADSDRAVNDVTVTAAAGRPRSGAGPGPGPACRGASGSLSLSTHVTQHRTRHPGLRLVTQPCSSDSYVIRSVPDLSHLM